MSEPRVPILLVAHPGFEEGLLSAAGAILGERPRVDAFSNQGLSREVVEARIEAWLDAHPGPALILTDLGFGSCCQAARLASRGRDHVGIVTGVNLPVFLAALRSREQDGLEDLLRHLHDRGRDGVMAYLAGEVL